MKALSARLPILLGLLLSLTMTLGCFVKGQVVITSHASPFFTTDSSVLITGGVSGVAPSEIVSVNVNGIATALDSNQQFSANVPLDASKIIVPIVAEVETFQGKLRDRVTFVVANGTTTDFVADGDFSRRAAGLHITKRGFDTVEKQATSIIPIDVGSFIPTGTFLVQDECVLRFLFCITRLDVVATDPPPSFTDVAIDLTPQAGLVNTDLTVTGLHLNAQARTRSLRFIPVNCRVSVDLQSLSINGDYNLSPDAARRRFVDVVQIGSPTSSFSGLGFNFVGGICSIPLITPIINAILPDVQSLFDRGFARILADPDGSGPADAPIAAAVETALATIEIDGVIGNTIGVELVAPMDDVVQTTSGVTLVSDLKVTANNPDPRAFDQPASFVVPQAFPVLGDLTPSGNPYDAAITIGASGFNQLLKALIESGVLLGEVRELTLTPGGNPIPLTAGVLAVFFPPLRTLPADQPLVLEVLPTAAPIIVGKPGANGELAELLVGGLKTIIRTDEATPNLILEIISDIPVPIDLAFVDGGVSFSFVPPAPSDITLAIVKNPFNIDEFLITLLIPTFLPSVLPEVTASLSSFPIPDLLGFTFTNAEVAMAGEFFAIYGDLR